MKFKSILITSVTAISLLNPLESVITNSRSLIAHAKTTNKNQKKLASVIPPVHNNYWFQWRHVILTKPLTVNLTEWSKNSLGGWKSKITKKSKIPTGTTVYITGNTTNFTIMYDQPKDTNTDTGHQTILHAKITGTPNVKLIDDGYNTSVAVLDYQQAKVKQFNSRKWHLGFYNNGGDEPTLLFKTKTAFQKYDKLADAMAEIGDGTDGDYGDLSKKELAYIKRTTKKYNVAKKVAIKFSNSKKAVQAKIFNDEILMVKLNKHIYYTDGGVNSSILPYNVQNAGGTIQSTLNPTAKDHQFVVAKGSPLFLYQGEKWIGPHKWQYNGKQWIRNNHIKW